MRYQKDLPGTILVSLLCLILLFLPVSAEDDFGADNGPIMKIDLGVTELALNVGETYTFRITYEPNDPAFPWLNWFVTNDTVVSIDPETSTLTALSAGETRILAEDSDGVAYAFCDVSVSGAKAYGDPELTAGASLIMLSKEDQEKITAPALRRFLDFVNDSDFSAGAADQASERVFIVPAEVKPGTENAQAERALSFGMEKATPLTYLHMVTLHGTFEQILAFAAGNPDLIEIFDLMPVYVEDPVVINEEPLQKMAALDGNVEELTSISTAHGLGFTGKGTTIAVLDSGLNRAHPEFRGRIKYQACFSTDMKSGVTVYSSVCYTAKSASPGKAKVKENFNHGSHVAGIAAGKNGIAPEADIIAVQLFTEKCKNKASAASCTTKVILSNNELEAFDYLLELNGKGVNIAAVNMSFGGGVYSSVCNKVRVGSYRNLHDIMELMVNEGKMIPVAASGNGGYEEYITQPACDSDVIAVGALEDSPKPVIKYFSNHNALINFLAPGTDIYSASYTKHDGKYYMKMSGTSLAAPMVTGAFAILKQIYPYNDPADLEKLLNRITDVSVKYRNAGYVYDEYHSLIPVPAITFPFSKPVLNFSRLGDFVCPELTQNDVTVEGISSGILLTLPYDPSSNYEVEIYDPAEEKYVEGLTYKSEKDPSGKYLLITVSGSGLVNDHVYNVIIAPYMEIGNTRYHREHLTVSVMPAEPISITVKPLSGGCQLTAVNPSPETSVRFFIYDAESQEPVRQKTPAGTKMVAGISGLKNGRVYFAAAQTYKAVDRRNIVTGAISDPVYFIPMSAPTGIRIKWNDASTAVIYSAKDKKATGFRVFYRPMDGNLNGGLVDACQVPFDDVCTINGLDKDSGYDFYVMKYTETEETHDLFYGPGLIRRYKSALSGLTAPDSVEITIDSGSKAVVRIAGSKLAEGLSVLFKRGSSSSYEFGCEAAGDFCEIGDIKSADPASYYTFFVMQYRWLRGNKVYSPGVTVYNHFGPKSAEPDAGSVKLPDENIPIVEPDINEFPADFMTEEDIFRDEALERMGSRSAGEWDLTEKIAFLKSADAFAEDALTEETDAVEKAAAGTEIRSAVEEKAGEPLPEQDVDWKFYRMESRGEPYVPSFGF